MLMYWLKRYICFVRVVYLFTFVEGRWVGGVIYSIGVLSFFGIFVYDEVKFMVMIIICVRFCILIF